jgi:tripartite-type tricarboxylate transporter receptor subunit TctC
MRSSEQKAWKIVTTIFVVLLLLWAPAMSVAQEYPTKPINLTVGVGTGGTVDISSRLLAARAEKLLGQPIVITNNGGGAGSVALGILAKAKPDGYSLVTSPQAPLVEVPHLRPVPYKFDDIIPVMQYAEPESGVVVRADSPFKTFKDLVEFARKNPGKVTYTTTSTSTPHALAMIYVGKHEKIQWSAIPVPSGDPNMPLLGGHVTAFTGSTSWKRYVDTGQFRPLVVQGEKRMKAFPDVPTLKELGYDFVTLSFYVLWTVKGTPAPIVKKLEDAFHKATEDPEFVAYMKKAEMPIGYRNSEGTKKHLQEAYERFGKMIVELQIPREK